MTPVRLEHTAPLSGDKHSTTELPKSTKHETCYSADYGNLIKYDHTLVNLTSNFFVLCANVKVNLYDYSWWAELSMNIHEGKG